MAYSTIADIADAVGGGPLARRIAACVAQEQVSPGSEEVWVSDHRWQYASQPGWEAAWQFAVDSGNDPFDESVITDGMILSATQAMEVEQ
jgi:hypothetical protein